MGLKKFQLSTGLFSRERNHPRLFGCRAWNTQKLLQDSSISDQDNNVIIEITEFSRIAQKKRTMVVSD